MSLVQRRILAALVGLIVLGGSARAIATPIFEPNNSAGTATVLNSDQLTVTDSLNANVGRPDTLLGHFDPAYSALLDSDDNGSLLGNGFASQLKEVDVPLEPNGSAYFRVTGAGDTSFIGAHSQSGQYYVRFDLFDANSVYFKTLSLEFESVAGGFVDNIWVDPPVTPEPQRLGGRVTATVQNIVGPGLGDSVDFFLFSGLQPNQEFTAALSGVSFDSRLGWFGGPSNNLLGSANGPTAIVAGVADGLGRALLAVTGAGDTQFQGVHAEVGTYTLLVTPIAVPEPASVALLGSGAALAAFFGLQRRRRRR